MDRRAPGRVAPKGSRFGRQPEQMQRVHQKQRASEQTDKGSWAKRRVGHLASLDDGASEQMCLASLRQGIPRFARHRASSFSQEPAARVRDQHFRPRVREADISVC